MKSRDKLSAAIRLSSEAEDEENGGSPTLKRIAILLGVFTLFVVLTPILLNFIPIKFAVKLEDAQQNVETGTYICVTESKYVVDTGWIAEATINPHIAEDLPVRVSGDSPSNYLSEQDFELRRFEVENRFLLIGKVDRFEKDTEYGTDLMYANLNVDKWDIIYPINRASIRQYITPKSYLNIYDYDLKKVIKTIWKSIDLQF
ncbi:hypothetical protein KIH86_25825 [Paenibacillus sp. HN-1]|uniref:hypothetical protein n=1 Tax=Paenibacillus sp. CGMCC 1.18879 TaxID=2834466 RepID=UPI001CA87D0B|nr:hypothetical protein [Paenibacillus sp. CGMCC 1.18879]MBY9079010.1 hypothetical protein [Paenibacillus sp. CGMCC 1.18879]MBY9087612.1 hypothetical protein [Paenibacillus sinensis]